MVPLAIAAITSLIVLLPTQSGDTSYSSWSLPVWVQRTLRAPAFSKKYELYFGVNPYYQRGDFDGDGAPDVAVLMRERSTKKVGIALVHATSRTWHVVGAGSSLGNGGDDWRWLGAWRVEPGTTLAEVPGFRAEVLFVEAPESASALVYWDGQRYRWVQRGN